MTVYYMQDGLYNFQQTSKVQAFQPVSFYLRSINPGSNARQGFRMFIGDVNARTKEEAERFRQLTFTCLENIPTRDPQTLDFPTEPCKTGIMTAVRFPTYVQYAPIPATPPFLFHILADSTTRCWDGKNLDSPDHMAHMSYPEFGSFESGGPCPASHPVRMGQLFYEVIWDTSKFNDKADWPEDGSQPFVWSFGDG